MVSFGSKALPLRRRKDFSIEENCISFEGGDRYYQGRRRSMGRRANKKQSGSDGSYHSKSAYGDAEGQTVKGWKSSGGFSNPDTSYVRTLVDPETAKYYTEIATVLESGEVELEDRHVVCGNALEESRGKEVELANDVYISHTIQILLEGCDADHLCGFLHGAAKDFAHIATDRCGSHVAESAFKSLASHLVDDNFYNLIKDTLKSICQAIVQNPVYVMCNPHGSHVLRTLLCLCKGVPLDSEFHTPKSSTVLGRRLNVTSKKGSGSDMSNVHGGFPDLLEFLVSEMLKCSQPDIATLQVDQYSSLVLQTALRLLVGQEQGLVHIILAIMGCNVENGEEGDFIKIDEAQNIRELVKENAFSHLMEVIVEVAPDSLYDEIFVKIFKGALYDISCHYSANFVVQALVSHARNPSHIEAIGEELGPKIKDLLELGKPGVVASIVAASQRLHAYEHKCSKALAAAVSTTNEPPKCIIPRLLLLESYLFSNDKSNWSWTSGHKIHLMGSLILQSLFKYPSEYIQPFIISITSMENSQAVEAAKDGSGARVIEAFLGSSASDKQKKKLISKLKGHFGELAMHPSGTFTVEKCFNAGDISSRGAIVSELVAVQKELSKTKQGPLLLKNLDVEGYSRRPEQWVSRQKSKLTFYKEIMTDFGEEGSKSSKRKNPPVDNLCKASQQTGMKKMREDIDNVLTSCPDPDASKTHKKQKKTRKNHDDENVEREQSADKKKRKHHKKDDQSKSSKKKLKT